MQVHNVTAIGTANTLRLDTDADLIKRSAALLTAACTSELLQCTVV
jgi:hypothetical protein